MFQDSEMNIDDILSMIPTLESFENIDPASSEIINPLDPASFENIDPLDLPAPDHIDQLDPTASDHIDDQLLETEQKSSGWELITFLYLTSSFSKRNCWRI